jgi:single-stranded DNA-binding protein
MNLVILGGLVTSVAEPQQTNDGRGVCRFQMTTSNGRDRTGRLRRPDEHNCVIWGRDPDDGHPHRIATTLKINDYVSITGKIGTARWMRGGQERMRREISVNTIELIDCKSSTNGEKNRAPEDTVNVEAGND